MPAQSVEDGAVRLQATERYIAEARIEGGSARLRERIGSYGEKIRESRPLTAAVLERYVLLVNDHPPIGKRSGKDRILRRSPLRTDT